MAESLKDSYDEITALLEDAVELTSEYDSWESRGIEYRIDGDGVTYGREFTKRLLTLGYVPVSCTREQLVISPIRAPSGN